MPRSAYSVRSSTFTSSRRRCDSSVICWFSITCLISGRARNSLSSRPRLCVCQALNDSRFSIRRCRRMPLSRRMVVTSRWPLCSSPTAPSISSSVPSRMFASGVLSSWDMWRRKRLRSSASSSRRWRSHSSWRPRRSRSRGPVTSIACENVPRPSSLIARSMARNGRPIQKITTSTTARVSGISRADCQNRRVRALSVLAFSAASSSSSWRLPPSARRAATSLIGPNWASSVSNAAEAGGVASRLARTSFCSRASSARAAPDWAPSSWPDSWRRVTETRSSFCW